jgi:glucose/arabinose dehydrogenase
VTAKRALIVPLALALAVGVAALVARAGTAPHVGRVKIATGLKAPVYVAVAPGEPQRFYIVEQRGLILAQRLDGRRSVFLDIRRLVLNRALAGLFAVAFDPQYRQTGLFFVDYVGRDFDVHVDSFRATGMRVSAGSREELLHVHEPSHDPDNHFGGQLAFGPDGKLYVGIGDGSADASAQDPASLLGKIVRLDIDHPPAEPEIVALGLRNPWRFSFDRKTGDLYVGDVGADTWEEVDRVPRGTAWPVNFGWPEYEGRAHRSAPGSLGPGTLVSPIIVYRHPKKGCRSVVGGYVYRGRAVAALRNRYVFGDFCLGAIWSIPVGGPTFPLRREGSLGFLLSSFGEDSRGELYVIAYTYKVSWLYRITPGRGG